MYEKLLIAHQSLMLIIAITLIAMLYQTNNNKRINELETRQTNHLVYLESRLSADSSKLDKIANSFDSRLNLIELRQPIEITQKNNRN